MRKLISVVLAGFFTFSQAGAEEPPVLDGVTGTHGIAMHGDLKYGPDFTHFDYVNPEAPKGGSMRRATLGNGYDNFNVITQKGTLVTGIGLVYESLMSSSGDEAFSMYGELAEYIFMPEDRSWVAFQLHEEAKWHDGAPITAEDVIWTFNTLREKGRPHYQQYYHDVSEAVALDDKTVRFNFTTNQNKELPLIVGQLIVLPKHFFEGKDVTAILLDKPLGSGPYRVKKFETNRSVTYERVPDFWGKDIPVNKGKHNLDILHFDYFGDSTIALEAFKAGDLDYRSENTAKNWAREYDIPALKEGRIVKAKFDDETTQVMLGLIFNQRRDLFKDPRVRKALSYSFDFEWTNKNLFFGQYNRLRSFFGKGVLAAKGLPEGRELEILEKYRGRVPEQLFTEEYNPPTNQTPLDFRNHLLDGARLLKEAGWVINPETLMLENAETGRPFKFDIIMNGSTLQSVLLPITRNLRRLGIDAQLKILDSSQYINRLRSWDYDVIYLGWAQALSPGNEQRSYWGSDTADQPGSSNYMGLKNEVVDELIDMVINAPTRKELEYRTRALDRVLQWQYLLLPSYYADFDRIARWNKYGLPKKVPWSGYDPSTWWYDEELARQHGLTEQVGG